VSETFTIPGFGSITIPGSLGALGAGPAAINDAGQIVGDGFLGCFEATRAFLWQAGEPTDLGTLAAEGPFTDSYAEDINQVGQIVGGASTGRVQREGNGFIIGCVTDVEFHAVLWQEGVIIDLGAPPGGLDTGAVAINDVGQILGWAEAPVDDDGPCAPAHPRYPVLWEQRAGRWEFIDLRERGVPGLGRDINNLGQIVGRTGAGLDPDSRTPSGEAYLWIDGILTALGTLGGEASEAVAINDAGQVVGWAETADTPADPDAREPVKHAFLWEASAVIDLGTLGGERSEAHAINNLGWIVGWSETGEGSLVQPVRHGFLWQEGRMADLNDLLPADAEWVIEAALGINDAGQFIAAGTRTTVDPQSGETTSQWHSFLLTLDPYGDWW
jgi:probable HAF family extracellular repeat protein